MKINENLKKYRQAAGLTQQQAADLLGFKTHTSYSHWESGRNSPSVSDLERIASAFGVTVKKLLFGEDETQAQKEYERIKMKMDFLERENNLYRAVLEKDGLKLGKYEGKAMLPKVELYRIGNPKRVLFTQAWGLDRSQFGSYPARR